MNVELAFLIVLIEALILLGIVFAVYNADTSRIYWLDDRLSAISAAVAQALGAGYASGAFDVHVDTALIQRARLPIDRMLAFTAALRAGLVTTGLVPHIGAA